MNEYYVYNGETLVGSYDEVGIIKRIKNEKFQKDFLIKESLYGDIVKISEHEKFAFFFDRGSANDSAKLPSQGYDAGKLIAESFFIFLSNIPLLIFTIFIIFLIISLPVALFRDLPTAVAVSASFYLIFFLTNFYIGISNSFIQEEVFSTSKLLHLMSTKILAFLFSSLLLGVALVISFAALIVPGVFVFTYLCFTPVIIEESPRAAVIKSMRESYIFMQEKNKNIFQPVMTIVVLYVLALLVFGTAVFMQIKSALFFLSIIPLFMILPVMAISFSNIYKNAS